MQTRDTYTPIAVALLFIAGAVFYLANGYTEMAGSDMWWHIAAGRELLQTGTLWMVDDWSYSAYGKDWLNHEWLSDIIYYQWVSVWGVHSLVYWKWLVVIAHFSALQWALVRQTGDHVAALLCAGIAIAIAAPFIDVRPHLYSLLNFSILLLLLLGRQARLWALGLLFLIWVNLHGGFFFGLMAAGILVFPWRNFSLVNLRTAVIIGLVCLLAATLNPSGLKTFLYPLKYAFDDTSPFRQLGEWLSPFLKGGITSPLFYIFMWVPLLGLGYFLPRVRKTVDVPVEGISANAVDPGDGADQSPFYSAVWYVARGDDGAAGGVLFCKIAGAALCAAYCARGSAVCRLSAVSLPVEVRPGFSLPDGGIQLPGRYAQLH